VVERQAGRPPVSQIEYTPEQQKAIDMAAGRLRRGIPLTTLFGSAGTGKTTVAKAIAAAVGAGVAFCAPTGKAALVLQRKGVPATTVHSLIYRPVGVSEKYLESLNEKLEKETDEAKRDLLREEITELLAALASPSFYKRDYLEEEPQAIILDESSMVSGQMLDDLMSFGVPVLALGDPAQLPPVNATTPLSEANFVPTIMLTTPHRFAECSPVHYFAMRVRDRGVSGVDSWRQGSGLNLVPSFDLPGEKLLRFDQVICGRNATRMRLNLVMRNALGKPVDEIDDDDRLVCLRNDPRLGLVNGEQYTVKELVEDLHVPESKLMRIEGFTAEGIFPLFAWAYAITCHKCVDDQTQIFTTEGWKNHDDLCEGDMALTLNPDTQLSEWQPVRAVHCYDVENEQLLSIEAESHSSLTTLNHRWAVRGAHGKTVWRTSEHLRDNPSGYHGIFKAAHHAGFPDTPKHTDAFVELVAWFWTEGSVYTSKGTKIGAVKIQQSQTVNPEKVARIRAALVAEFGSPRRLGRWTTTDPGWSESVRTMTQATKNGGKVYPERTFEYVTFSLNNAAGSALQECAPDCSVTSEFLLSLTKSQLELFIHCSILGDGTVDGEHASIRQGSRERLEAFQFACVLAGYSTVIRRDANGTTWSFRLKKGQILNPRSDRWSQAMKTVSYTGVVWCPQTANGTWLAKRNETTYFTGNSQGSEWPTVVVLDESSTFGVHADQWLYTAITRAADKVVVLRSN
jgi:hypothetical protein